MRTEFYEKWLVAYLKKIKKWNVLNNRAIEAFIMFKEKKVCESSIYDLWIFSAEFYKLKPLFAAVTSSPEGCGILVFPRWASVCLDWHHIQADSAGERSDLIVKPIGNFFKVQLLKRVHSTHRQRAKMKASHGHTMMCYCISHLQQ